MARLAQLTRQPGYPAADAGQFGKGRVRAANRAARRRDSGFVLLNALLVVIAISAISTAMLMLSAEGRARLSDTQADAQLALYLDAAEALIPEILEGEWEKDGSDHLEEIWASADLSVPIDRGTVSVRLRDLQGRLNANLLNIDDARAGDEFRQLFTALGLPPALLAAMRDWLAEGGPPNVSPYLTRPIPVLPRGGTAVLLDQLRGIEGMTASRFDRLAPLVAVLPYAVSLNVNTAPPEVLAAAMPEFSPVDIAAIIRSRADTPFDNAIDFRSRMSEMFGETALETLPLERMTARTAWFEASIAAEIDGRRMGRRVILHRDDSEEGKTRRLFSVPDMPSVPTQDMR